ncbi:MAG: chemotaxis protein CheX [Phycisphaerae bacterium]
MPENDPLAAKHAAFVETFVNSLDLMAFMPADPAEPLSRPSGECVHGRISFKGPYSGTMEIVCPKSFCRELAGNVLGCAPADEQALQAADDALCELLNVTVGAMMPHVADTPSQIFSLALPAMEAFDVEQKWEGFTQGRGAAVLFCEGHVIAVRLSIVATKSAAAA